MTTGRMIPWLLVAVLVVAGGWWGWRTYRQPILPTPEATTTVTTSVTTTETVTPSPSETPAADVSELIFVVSPTSGQKVASPLSISGEARGQWFFEASFPIEVQDANGVVLGRGQGQTLSDWMTRDFVPFIAVIEFTQPTTPTGVVVLKKDNPSGLPENDGELSVPVRF